MIFRAAITPEKKHSRNSFSSVQFSSYSSADTTLNVSVMNGKLLCMFSEAFAMTSPLLQDCPKGLNPKEQ